MKNLSKAVERAINGLSIFSLGSINEENKEAYDFLKDYIKVPFVVASSKKFIGITVFVDNIKLIVKYPKQKGIFHNYHEVLQQIKKTARQQKLNSFKIFQ